MEGLKFDDGKPPLSLISRRANEQEARVLDFGRRKYNSWNWSLGMQWSRVLDAVMRHVAAYADGETFDPESGLSHLAHARCGLGFLLDYEESHPELDDRRPRSKKGTNENPATISDSQLYLRFRPDSNGIACHQDPDGDGR